MNEISYEGLLSRLMRADKGLTDIFGLDLGTLGKGHEAVKDGLIEGGVGGEQGIGHSGG